MNAVTDSTDEQVLGALDFDPEVLCSWTDRTHGRTCDQVAEWRASCASGCGASSPVCAAHKDEVLRVPFHGRCLRCGLQGVYREILRWTAVVS